MNNRNPRVTIGMPVFNGEKYLEEALNSILSQTYSDFQLIISDNASTDGTEEICRAYGAKDRRIHYCRNDRNVGAAENFNRVFRLSSGEYFKWAACDDFIAQDFLSKCIEVLDQFPSVVLCHSKTVIVDEQGKPIARYTVNLRTDSTKPHRRFRETIGIEHWCFQVFGVIRASALGMTSLIAAYTGSDRTLLAELSLMGQMYQIPECLFFRRGHPGTSTNLFPDKRDRMAWFDPGAHSRFPTLLKFRGYVSSVARVSMSRYERVLCYAELGRTAVEKMWLRLKRKGRISEDLSHVIMPLDNAGEQI